MKRRRNVRCRNGTVPSCLAPSRRRRNGGAEMALPRHIYTTLNLGCHTWSKETGRSLLYTYVVTLMIEIVVSYIIYICLHV